MAEIYYHVFYRHKIVDSSRTIEAINWRISYDGARSNRIV